MPKGTRVERCYQKLKGTKGKASAAAICQSSTKQSLKTGKSLEETEMTKKIDESRRSDKRAEREDPDVRAKARRDRVIARLKAHGVVKTKEGRFRTNDKGEKERVDEMYPFPSRKELKPLTKGGPLKARDLAKKFGAPKPRSMETDRKPLLPSKNELAAGWKNDKAKLAKTGSYIMKKIGMNEEELMEERKNTEAAVKAFLNKSKYKGKNTHVHDEDGIHVMKLHGNTIAKHYQDGSIEVTHAGWPTPTTRNRTSAIAHALNKGGFYQKKHQLHGPDDKPLGSREWTKLREELENYVNMLNEENDMDNDPTSNLVNALVDKDALGVKDAFADAMQNHILPDMLETEKERIAQTIIPQEDNDDDISDEEMDAFFDGLSDEELDEIMDAISSEEIPDEDFEGNVDDDSEEFDVDEK